MGEDELATIEDCIRRAYVECLIDEDGARRLLAEVERLRGALGRLARVGGEVSYRMAGAHWDELCGALSEAREALRQGN